MEGINMGDSWKGEVKRANLKDKKHLSRDKVTVGTRTSR
ncbi:hypothetical protein CCACVL1_17235 [Corchorus capsularis]|uniref:Uncharacterized protein n=1 Tax=Corchorus capsularis TaxID=210143 RepID=A0A1R3HTM1_COCAP|nr:hypothetical protein CCACVL1_17235 [Corchorus capsularis]